MGGTPRRSRTRSKRSHAAGFTLRYRPWRLPFSQRERLAPAVGCPKGCREKTGLPHHFKSTKRLRCISFDFYFSTRGCALSVAMPQALRLRSVQVTFDFRLAVLVSILVTSVGTLKVSFECLSHSGHYNCCYRKRYCCYSDSRIICKYRYSRSSDRYPYTALF